MQNRDGRFTRDSLLTHVILTVIDDDACSDSPYFSRSLASVEFHIYVTLRLFSGFSVANCNKTLTSFTPSSERDFEILSNESQIIYIEIEAILK